jgi:hypothetical protein
MKWEWHVARLGDNINACKVLVGNWQERDHFENLVINGDNIKRTLLV